MAAEITRDDLTPARIRVLVDFRDGTRKAPYTEWCAEHGWLVEHGLLTWATGERGAAITDAGRLALRRDEGKKLTQPIDYDELSGHLRFIANPLVSRLLHEASARGFDLGKLIAAGSDMPACRWADNDVEQFYQLIGYTIDGYGQLDFISDEAVEQAETEAEKVLASYGVTRSEAQRTRRGAKR